jgi:hypothetical protein
MGSFRASLCQNFLFFTKNRNKCHQIFRNRTRISRPPRSSSGRPLRARRGFGAQEDTAEGDTAKTPSASEKEARALSRSGAPLGSSGRTRHTHRGPRAASSGANAPCCNPPSRRAAPRLASPRRRAAPQRAAAPRRAAPRRPRAAPPRRSGVPLLRARPHGALSVARSARSGPPSGRRGGVNRCVFKRDRRPDRGSDRAVARHEGHTSGSKSSHSGASARMRNPPSVKHPRLSARRRPARLRDSARFYGW